MGAFLRPCPSWISTTPQVPMFGFPGLPIRIFDDLRIEADLNARLTPDQAQLVAQHLITASVQKRIADRIEAPVAVAPRARRKVMA